MSKREIKVCKVEKFTIADSENLFNLGCSADTHCQNTSTSKLYRPAKKNQVPFIGCKECCSDDLCNAAGCVERGFPVLRGPVCFDCYQSTNISKCNKIGICSENEVCKIEELEEFGERYFTTSCIDKGACRTTTINQIFGKRGEYRNAIKTICSACCHEDLCNNNCRNDKTQTTSKIQTTSIQKESTTPVYSTTKAAVYQKGHSGTDFWIAFSAVYRYAYRSSTHLKIFITTNVSTGKALTLGTNTPINSSNLLFDTEHLSNGIPYKFVQNYNIIEELGISVKSNNSVSLYTFSERVSQFSDVSWVPSTAQLGLAYKAASYHPFSSSDYSVISIVAVEADTSFNITLNTTGTVGYNGKTFRNGDIFNLYLHKFQSYQLSCSKDITGSLIQSNRPISVQSGITGYYIDSGGCYTAGSLYLPPIKSWGSVFVIPPILAAKRYVIRIVPSQLNTTITITKHNGKTTHQLTTTLEFNYPANDTLVVTCNNPCFVYQIPASESDRAATSYIAIVPAAEQFSRDYDVLSPNFISYKKHFLSIMIKSDAASGLLLNGTSIFGFKTIINTVNVSGTTWSVLSLPVPYGIHKVTHTSYNSVYGLIAYGFGDCMSYGYTAGLNI